jgi:hypothetical protein
VLHVGLVPRERLMDHGVCFSFYNIIVTVSNLTWPSDLIDC